MRKIYFSKRISSSSTVCYSFFVLCCVNLDFFKFRDLSSRVMWPSVVGILGVEWPFEAGTDVFVELSNHQHPFWRTFFANLLLSSHTLVSGSWTRTSSSFSSGSGSITDLSNNFSLDSLFPQDLLVEPWHCRTFSSPRTCHLVEVDRWSFFGCSGTLLHFFAIASHRDSTHGLD